MLLSSALNVGETLRNPDVANLRVVRSSYVFKHNKSIQYIFLHTAIVFSDANSLWYRRSLRDNTCCRGNYCLCADGVGPYLALPLALPKMALPWHCHGTATGTAMALPLLEKSEKYITQGYMMCVIGYVRLFYLPSLGMAN